MGTVCFPVYIMEELSLHRICCFDWIISNKWNEVKLVQYKIRHTTLAFSFPVPDTHTLTPRQRVSEKRASEKEPESREEREGNSNKSTANKAMWYFDQGNNSVALKSLQLFFFFLQGPLSTREIAGIHLCSWYYMEMWCLLWLISFDETRFARRGNSVEQMWRRMIGFTLQQHWNSDRRR